MYMKAVEVKKGIYWVGAVDWSIRNFHGYLTERGTTYGAYLIVDQKVALIDTVKAEFAQEMLKRIQDIVPLEKIDIVISNHVEMDHSGAIPEIKKYCPQAEIYTSAPAGVKGLTLHYGEYDYKPLKSGDSLSLGKRTLQFVATPMLHWPDNMVAYCPEEKILFSNDAFGQHFASTERFDDELDIPVVYHEAKKYYANIIMCYGKQAQTAWKTVSSLELDMIAPAHGVIWKNHIKEILAAYELWSSNEPESGAMVVYDSMWHSTEKMALAIGEGFRSAGISTRLYDLKANHWSNIVPDVLTSRYIAVGSPTLNSQMMPNVAAFLCYLKGLSPKNRQAFAFGSHGWGGQSVGLIEKELEECGFTLCMEGIRQQYIPDDKRLKEIEQLVEKKFI